jgi:hypothetical protein
MKYIKLTKRLNEHENCLILWTPWTTVVWDRGSIQCRGTDEFELVIKYRAWGPIFYFGNRDIEKLGERSKFDSFQWTRIQPRYAESRARRISDRDYFENKEQLVRQRKRKNPADMTYPERHAATLEVISKMKFSDNFMHLMTTPYGKLALERGEECKDDATGELLTEDMYARDKEKNLRIAPRTGGGLLGFKRAENGEGYGTIRRVPAIETMEITSGQSEILQLEDGQ